MVHLSLSLFGSFQATLNREPLIGFDSDKVRALLVYLAVESDRPHSRPSLIGMFWPDRPEHKARHSLRQALSNLRRLIDDDRMAHLHLEITYYDLRFDADSDVWLDVASFTYLVAACQRHVHTQLATCEPCLKHLEQAVALYKGAFLEGFSLADAPAFEEWLIVQREHLQSLAIKTLQELAGAYEERGEFERGLSAARQAVALDPFCESSHRDLMRLLALEGQRSAAIAHYHDCCRLFADELGIEVEEKTRSLYTRICDETFPAVVSREEGLERLCSTVGACPYRGLFAFRETDALFFYGRESFSARLAEAVKAQPMVVLVGSSGSGKSSAVLAGLLPQLRTEGGWLIATLRPGVQPFQALSRALISLLQPRMAESSRLAECRRLADALSEGLVSLRDLLAQIRNKVIRQLHNRYEEHPRILLIVDQFEELYTLCPDPQVRRRFVDMLLAAVHDAFSICEGARPFALLLTLRADFMGQVLAYRPFVDILGPAICVLGPMTRDELRAAIEKPAAAQGAIFQSGLVERLLDDVGEEPGALPLLEFTLTLLWERLNAGWLTHVAYESIGRVEGALAQYAEEEFRALGMHNHAVVRRIFVQLVQPGEGTEDTRRTAARGDLGDAAWTLVQHLSNRRLVVTNREPITGVETVEVVHEALIQQWDRLQAWMAEDRSFRMWQERLRVSLRTWEATNRDEGALLRGVPLSQAEEWLGTRDTDLSAKERAYIDVSIALRERRAVERKAQLQRERDAAKQLAEAHSQALRQAAVGLASEAKMRMQGPDQDIAVLLALEALESYPYTWQAEHALAEIVLEWRLLWQFSDQVPIVSPGLFAPDKVHLLTAHHDGVLRLWDLRTHEGILTVQAYRGIEGNYCWAIWSPDGNRILTCTGWVGGPRIWDAKTGELLLEFAVGGGFANWSPDGAQVLTHGGEQEDAAIVWDARTGKQLLVLSSDRRKANSTSFSPNGKWIVTSLGQIWDAKTGRQIHTLYAYQDLITRYNQPWFSWARIASQVGTGMGGTACVWDAETGEKILTLETGYSGKADLWWSPADERLLTTGYTRENSPAALWDAMTGERLHELPYYDAMHYLTDPWSPDGKRIALIDAQGYVNVYDVASGREHLRLRASHNDARVNWLPDSSGFVTTGADGNVRIWRISAAELAIHCSEEAGVCITPGFRAPVWLCDGTKVGRNFRDGTVRIWNLASGEETLLIQKLDQKGTPVVVNWMALSPDSRRILTGALNGDVDIWDSATGEHLLSFSGHARVVLGVAWSPDGRRAVSCSRDRRAVVWDTETGEALTVFTGRDFYWGDWSPDGDHIVLIDQFSYSGSVRIWNAASGEVYQTLLPDDFSSGTSAVAWSPDGAHIVTFSLDGLGRLWDARNGKLCASFPAERLSIVAEWSPSGRRFLVGGYEGIRVYDTASLEEIIAYPADGEAEARWSPDGKHIAVAYPNGDLKVYPAWESLEDLITYAKSHCVLRDLNPEERARFGLPTGA